MYARDALAKAVYDRLFTWLVTKLNQSLEPDYDGKKTLMGILDIYGFEIFEKNRFVLVVDLTNEFATFNP